MVSGDLSNDGDRSSVKRDHNSGRYRVMVSLDREQMAAAEGWRAAHGIADQAEALGELVRLGLLGEVAKIYRLVGGDRTRNQHENGESHP